MKERLHLLDTSAWPMMRMRLPSVFGPEHIKAIIDGFEHAYERKERFVVLADGSQVVKFPGTVERKMLSDWLARPERTAQERLYTVATAIVLTSGTMRAMLSAMQWVNRPATPQTWKPTELEALEWCCERLAEAGVPLSAAIEDARAEVRRQKLPSRRAP